MDTFTPELTFGPWVFGLMEPEAPGIPYKTIQAA
jgi:hypothetical protein